MTEHPTRRRAIRILAATAAAAATGGWADAETEWRGTALGADVSIRFRGAGRVDRQIAVDRILAEIDRQEAIFSLQIAGSELSRLNADGHIRNPSIDLVHVLSVALRIHAATSGKFDPTVQALWRYYVDWYAKDRSRGRPDDAVLSTLREKIGFHRVRVAPDLIEAPGGVMVTLNGIAQGHITDSGVRNSARSWLLRTCSSTSARCARSDPGPGGGGWRLQLPDGAPIVVSDGALSTSAGSATRLADNGDHHIFDPDTRRPAGIWEWVSVAHPSATVADGLSTGLYCLDPDACAVRWRRFPARDCGEAGARRRERMAAGSFDLPFVKARRRATGHQRRATFGRGSCGFQLFSFSWRLRRCSSPAPGPRMSNTARRSSRNA